MAAIARNVDWGPSGLDGSSMKSTTLGFLCIARGAETDGEDLSALGWSRIGSTNIWRPNRNNITR